MDPLMNLVCFQTGGPSHPMPSMEAAGVTRRPEENWLRGLCGRRQLHGAASQILLRVLRCWGSRWELLSFRRKSRKGWQETGSRMHPVLGCGECELTLRNTDRNTDRNTKSCSKVDRGAEALLLGLLLLGLLLLDYWVWAPGSSHTVSGFLFSVVSAELFSIHLLKKPLKTWLFPPQQHSCHLVSGDVSLS